MIILVKLIVIPYVKQRISFSLVDRKISEWVSNKIETHIFGLQMDCCLCFVLETVYNNSMYTNLSHLHVLFFVEFYDFEENVYIMTRMIENAVIVWNGKNCSEFFLSFLFVFFLHMTDIKLFANFVMSYITIKNIWIWTNYI